jgi:uncharacterized membrane protein YfhO
MSKSPVKKENKEVKISELKSTYALNPIDQYFGKRTVFLTIGALLMLAIWAYGSFWFTDNVFLFKDIGSDSINGLYPIYYWNAEILEKEGSFSWWSFSTGIGQNTMIGSYGDPFLFLSYLFGKDALIHLLGIIEPLKVVLAGISIYAYLRMMNLGFYASLVGAICYAFSGFMMIGSGWYGFTTEGLYFALLLLALELFILKGKWLLFPLVICLTAMLMPVDVYLMALLVGTYAVVRILHENNLNWIDLLKKLSFLAFLGILGIMMGAFLVLPTLELMVNSPRVLGGSSFFDTLSSKSIFDLTNPDLMATTKARWLAPDLLIDDNRNFKGAMNFLEAPAIYAGLPVIILAPMAFQLIQKRERIFYGILLGLYLLPLLFPYFRYAFWLFTGDYYRLYSLFVIIAMLILSVRALNELFKADKFPWIGFGVGALLMFYMLFSITNSQVVNLNEVSRNFTVIFILSYLICIGLMSSKVFRNKASLFFLLILILELGSTAYSTLNNRRVATASEFEKDKLGYNDYSRDAVKWIKAKDASNFRIEKNYASYNNNLILHASTNDAKVQDYWGTRSYHSFNHLNYVRFLSALDIINEKDENQTRWIAGVGMRPMINFLMGNKYFLSNQGKDAQLGFGYEYRHTVGDVSIFENPNYVPFGATYDKVIRRSDFDKLDKSLVQNVYGKKDIALLKACVMEDEDLKKVDLPIYKVDTINAQNFAFESLINDTKALRAEAFQMTKFKNDHFQGKISIKDKKKILFFSMPQDKGWTVKVDGKVAEILKVNIGLAGILLSPGDHEIEMIYNTPYLKEGMIISIIAWLIFIAAVVYYFISTKKSKLKVVS